MIRRRAPRGIPYPFGLVAVVGLSCLAAQPANAQSLVSGVRPERVTLAPGERPVEIVVTGRFFGEVRSGEARDAGFLFRDVAVQVLESSGDRVVLRVSATPSAVGPITLSVVLRTDREEIILPVTLELKGADRALQPVEVPAGVFQVTLASGMPTVFLDPVQIQVGTLQVTLSPSPIPEVLLEPVTADVGTFSVTLSPPPGGEG